MLLLTCGAYGNVIRFLYPLTIPQAVFDEGLDMLETAIAAEVLAGVAAQTQASGDSLPWRRVAKNGFRPSPE